MADDYTPTTAEVRGRHNANATLDGRTWRMADAEFDRWLIDMLAAHDAEKRAEWEAEQGEPEWEYACRDDRTGSVTSVGAPWMDHEYAERVTANEYPYMAGVRRRKAGPWLPVPDTTTEGDEFAPGECDGSGTCSAPIHVHGCYTPHRSDQCDSPEEYGHTDTTNHESEG